MGRCAQLNQEMDTCLVYQKVETLEKKVEELQPTRDLLALFDVVYELQQDMRMIARAARSQNPRAVKTDRMFISDVSDPYFQNCHPAARELIHNIMQTYGLDNMDPLDQFVRATRDVSNLRGPEAHTTTVEKTQIYNYDRLLDTTNDQDFKNLIKILREIPGRNRDFPLFRQHEIN